MEASAILDIENFDNLAVRRVKRVKLRHVQNFMTIGQNYADWVTYCDFSIFRSSPNVLIDLLLEVGAVVQRIERWTLRSVGRGSNPAQGNAAYPWASCLHLCASVTKQYNLVPAKGGDALRLGR